MIEFDCPHCANPFAVPQTLAGREGWCRVCKRLVIVPHADGGGPVWSELPVAEQCARLDRMLQYAAAKADRYKRLLARQSDELGLLVRRGTGPPQGPAEDAFHERIGAIKTEMKRLTRAVRDAGDSRRTAESERDESRAECERLKRELADAPPALWRGGEAYPVAPEIALPGAAAVEPGLERELEQLRDERDAIRAELSRALDALASSDARRAAAEAESGTARSTADTLSASMREVELERRHWTEERARPIETIAARPAEDPAIRDALEAAISESQALKKSLEVAMAELDRKATAAEAGMARMRDERDSALDAVRIAREESDTLAASMGEVELERRHWTEERARLIETIAARPAEDPAIRDALEAAISESQALKKSIEVAMAELDRKATAAEAGMARMRGERDSALDAVRLAREESETLRAAAASRDDAGAARETMAAEIASLGKAIANYEERISSLATVLDKAFDDRSRLAVERDALLDKLSDAEAHAAGFRETAESHAARIDDLSRELVELRRARVALDERGPGAQPSGTDPAGAPDETALAPLLDNGWAPGMDGGPAEGDTLMQSYLRFLRSR